MTWRVDTWEGMFKPVAAGPNETCAEIVGDELRIEVYDAHSGTVYAFVPLSVVRQIIEATETYEKAKGP